MTHLLSRCSHGCSQKKVISTESSPSRIHPSSPDNVIQTENAAWRFTNHAESRPALPKLHQIHPIFALYTNSVQLYTKGKE